MNTIEVKKIKPYKSVSKYLKDLFSDEDWSVFSGGYGYDKNDLVIIDTNSEFSGVELESRFIQARSYAELKNHGIKERHYKSVQLQKLNQQLIFTENKPIDILEYKIIATPFDVVEETKEIFFRNNPFRNPKIMEYIIDMLEDASVTYITKGYFDISNFYGKL